MIQKSKLNIFTTKQNKNKKNGENTTQIIVEVISSSNQIIENEIQLQLLITLYCFEEVLLAYLIVARDRKKEKNK